MKISQTKVREKIRRRKNHKNIVMNRLVWDGYNLLFRKIKENNHFLVSRR